jgi:hypothetical protein
MAVSHSRVFAAPCIIRVACAFIRCVNLRFSAYERAAVPDIHLSACDAIVFDTMAEVPTPKLVPASSLADDVGKISVDGLRICCLGAGKSHRHAELSYF